MFHSSMTILLVILVTLITGCSSSSPSFHKNGVSAYDGTNTLSECKYQVGLNKIPQDQQKRLIIECMQSKGFRYY